MFEKLYALRVKGIKPGLERIREVLKLLGNPEKSFESIVVAGTNGKGSTVNFLNSIFLENGERVGAYTSPHLINITERVRIGDGDVSEAELDFFVSSVIDLALKNGISLTFFEALTAAAFLIFKEKKVEKAVLEVGLGGRFDAVNVVEQKISVITDIDYDHEDYLGNTLSRITFEKAGIVKKGGEVFTYIKDELFNILSEFSKKNGAVKVFHLKNSAITLGERFFKTRDGLKIFPPLPGRHQVKNAALSYLVAKRTGVCDSVIKKGIEKTRFKGRIDIVSKKPVLIVDVAHNVQGIEALVQEIFKIAGKKKLGVVFGLKKGKNLKQILAEIIKISERIFVVEDQNYLYDSETVKEVLIRDFNFSEVKAFKSVRDGIREGLKHYEQGKDLCVCGSHIVCGEFYRIKS